MNPEKPLFYPALVVVDMQNYYLLPQSDFFCYAEKKSPGCMQYIQSRCENTVIPALQKLLAHFRSQKLPVIFLELSSGKKDRTDLHPAFLKAHQKALKEGFENLYPLKNDPLSKTHAAIAPLPHETVWVKTNFSGFTSSALHEILTQKNITDLVFTGLATSQCVDTTARDAADRGFGVIHIEDAQADYTRDFHYASFFASQGICGGRVVLAGCDLQRRGAARWQPGVGRYRGLGGRDRAVSADRHRRIDGPAGRQSGGQAIREKRQPDNDRRDQQQPAEVQAERHRSPDSDVSSAQRQFPVINRQLSAGV